MSLWSHCIHRQTFDVEADKHLESIGAAEEVILAGDWSSKIEITGMYTLLS